MLAYEDLMAFFLEATFLGILLSGRDLVPRWAHFLAACMVATGTLFSSFWILSVNSWMQMPSGFTLENGWFFPADLLAIIFNPSFPYRLAHNVSAFYVTTGFVVLAVAAWLVRRPDLAADGRRMFRMALGFLTVFVPLQIILGDAHGLNTAEYQPAKLAAMEGRWETASPGPLTLFGLPNAREGRVDYAGPFLAAMSLFSMSYLGVAVSLWPMIVPHRYTVWQAASAGGTQAFLLIGTLGLLPVILTYTAWSYWVFRGELRSGVGYH